MITHSWNGTVLTITSDSGTSSADLKGEMGVRGPQGLVGAPGANGANGSTVFYNAYLNGDDDGGYICDTTSVELYNKLANGENVRLVWEGSPDVYYLPVCFAIDYVVFSYMDDSFMALVYIVYEDGSVERYERPLAAYDDNGCLTTSEPTEDWHVAPKNYVDKAVKEPQYELITTATTTEDVKTFTVNGFNLKSIIAYYTVPKSTYSGGMNVRLYLDDGTTAGAWINSVNSTSQNQDFAIWCKVEGGLRNLQYVYPSTVGAMRRIDTLPTIDKNDANITEVMLLLAGTSTNNIPAGTTIELWGVRADV